VGKTVKAAMPATPATKLVSVKASAVQNFDELVTLSYEALLDAIIILLYGQFGAGKSTAMMTVSKHFPKTGLPTEKWRGNKPKHVLEDMFWFSFDRGATDGFRERGIAVPEFSVPTFMGKEKLWRKAGYSMKPNIMQAVDTGLQLAATAVSRGVEWIAVDTISTFDAALETHGRKNMPRSESKDSDDTRAMFGQMFYGHKLFHDGLRSLGCGILYSAHAKDMGDISKLKPNEKQRLITLTAAGMPSYMPQVTGKGAAVYKSDASLQLVIHAKRLPKDAKGKSAMVREAYTVKEDWESKNRFELSLDPVEKPDLGLMLKKIRG
jgi:hypothetical protein